MPADQVTAATRASTCAYNIVASKFVTNYRVDKSKDGSPRSCSIIVAILEPTKYLRTFFAADQCPSQGFCINVERIPIANEMSGLVVFR